MTMKTKILFFSISIFLLLACNALNPGGLPQDGPQVIGFEFFNQEPGIPTGDRSASTHLFIHKYPFPSDGIVTGVTFLNDSDGGAEMFTLLILRPTSEGWEVIHRVDIEADDMPVSKTGMTTVSFGVALDVKKGDIFAHWQPDDTGPIPMNEENEAVEGLSFGKVGFQSEDVEEGNIISKQGFSGGRDYFITLNFFGDN
jgi:hypothetical protein